MDANRFGVSTGPLDMTLTTRKILERLCAFDTTSWRSNLELVAFIAELLERHGVAYTLIHDATGTKANIVATIGPMRDGGIVLSGHTDVVPADGQQWTSDPFRVVEKDGRLVGRGVADMKGFIASCLAMVPHFQAASLKVPIHLVHSYDEEVGCLGIHSALLHLREAGMRPMAAIVGEPTGMLVVDAHKSCSRFTTCFTGLEGHSSDPRNGVNAVFYAARFVSFLEDLSREYSSRDVDPRFLPPTTTIHVGQMSGGTAPNIIPKTANVTWEVRALSVGHRDEVIAKVNAFIVTAIEPLMQVGHPQARVETACHSLGVGLVARRDCPARTLAFDLAGVNETQAVSYGTEAGLFQQHGIPTVICGPGHIEQAHKADEWIAISQLDACDKFLHRLLARVTAGTASR
jgi:acetylornithine deacetylase